MRRFLIHNPRVGTYNAWQTRRICRDLSRAKCNSKFAVTMSETTGLIGSMPLRQIRPSHIGSPFFTSRGFVSQNPNLIPIAISRGIRFSIIRLNIAPPHRAAYAVTEELFVSVMAGRQVWQQVIPMKPPSFSLSLSLSLSLSMSE